MILILIKSVCTKIDEDTQLLSQSFFIDGFTGLSLMLHWLMKSYCWFNCRGLGEKNPKCSPILKKVFYAFSYSAGRLNPHSFYFAFAVRYRY